MVFTALFGSICGATSATNPSLTAISSTVSTWFFASRTCPPCNTMSYSCALASVAVNNSAAPIITTAAEQYLSILICFLQESSTHDHTREGKIKIRDGPKRCHQPIVSQKYTSIGLATVSSTQSCPIKKEPLHRQRLMEGNIQKT